MNVSRITKPYLAQVVGAQGRMAEALELASKVLEIQRRVLGPEHPDTLHSRALLAQANEDVAEAEKLFAEIVDVKRRVFGEEHVSTLTSKYIMAERISAQGRYAEAERLFREVLETSRRVLGPEHPQAILFMGSLSGALRRQGRHTEAEEHLRERLELIRRVLGPEHWHMTTSLYNLSIVMATQDRIDEAEELLREAVEICRSSLGDEHRRTLRFLSTLILWRAEIVRKLTHAPGKSELEIARAVELGEHSVELSPEDPRCLSMLGRAHYRAGKWESSVEQLDRACALSRDGAISGEEWFFLAMSHWRLGHVQEAQEWYRKSIVWLQSGDRGDHMVTLRDEAEELLGISAAERRRLTIASVVETLENPPDDERARLDAVVLGLLLRNASPTAEDGSKHQQERFQLALDRSLEIGLELSRAAAEKNPGDWYGWDRWNRVALAYYRPRSWKGSEREARLAFELGKAVNSPNRMMSIVPFFLLAGKQVEYREVCDYLLENWQNWSGSDLGIAASLCALDPVPPETPEHLLRLAQRAVDEGPDWSLSTLWRVCCRVGDYEKAIEGLEAELQTVGAPPQFDLAIAHHFAGHPEKARAILEESLQAHEGWDIEWANTRIEVEVLRHEAVRLILGESETTPAGFHTEL